MGNKLSKWVVAFADGDETMRDVLGGKGAGLAGMTAAGFPVPPGFIVTTEACRKYYDEQKTPPEDLWEQVFVELERVEELTGKKFGDPKNPLLLSVRSGAPVSMPGMMDTILNLGLNDETVEGLAALTNDPGFAWDAYRRFVQMFGEIVFGVPNVHIAEAVEWARARSDGNTKLDPEHSKDLVARVKDIIRGHARRPVPDDPREQLRMSIRAVFDSWNTPRARDYRQANAISNDLFTAVNVQVMVFGNIGDDSGSGVAFTRNPTTGDASLYGEFLADAQGEDVVAGIRTPLPIAQMGETFPAVYEELLDIARRLEEHHQDMQDLEFTVEHGKLHMLQTRSGKRTGRAAIRIAVDQVAEGLISKEEALRRITADRLLEVLHPVVEPGPDDVVLAHGLPASPGGASGVVVFDPDVAVQRAEAGDKVILVRHETSPDDFHGMVAAAAIVTSRGGVTSHAAVVARGMGRSCVVGCEEIEVDYGLKLFRVGDRAVSAGEWITVDGNSGTVYLGKVATAQPEFDEHYETIMSWTDEFRVLGIRANADNPEDAATARSLGAEGIGLCRTEHMFFGADRIAAMREMITAPNQRARAEALAELEPLQISDFEGIFEAMDGCEVTIRLLDPPLHEFLPRREDTLIELTDRKLRLAHAQNLHEVDELLHEVAELEKMLEQVERLGELNPMLGHRGCRLGNTYPEITEMQARAILTAALRCRERGIDVHPEIMIPLVAFSSEYETQEAIVRAAADEVFAAHGTSIEYSVGTMIELPRAALTAGDIAEHAEFFSFGTNDLTQSTMGLSRDDAGRFLPGYVTKGLIENDPFQSLDKTGVGQLVEIARDRGRKTRPDIKLGICGEHGGDPASIQFFHEAGLDYVSCSPYRVPVARLAAARSALGD